MEYSGGFALQKAELKTTVGKRRPFRVCNCGFCANKLHDHTARPAKTSALRISLPDLIIWAAAAYHFLSNLLDVLLAVPVGQLSQVTSCSLQVFCIQT